VAEVTWFKDREKIVNASTKLIIYKGGARNSLTIVALDEEDFGNYTCLAENKLGVMQDSEKISGKRDREKGLKYIQPKQR
jgi:hypothetical protein